MIKFEKSPEISNVLNKISLNMAEILQLKEIPTLLKYHETYLTSSSEQILNKEYEKIGLPPVKHSYKEYYNIPYNRDIELNKIKNKSLKNIKVKKDYIIQADYPKYDKYLKSTIQLIAYDKDITIPNINENGLIWMSPTLLEYNTMKDSISKAHGKVLTFGLGCGFYQYLCSLKEDVQTITVVEINNDIIEFFTENILPQFPRAKDIKIIKGDAFDYFNDEFLKKYDYVFVDIWRNDYDGTIIYEKLINNITEHYDNIDYWIEDTILFHLKSVVAAYLYALYTGILTEWLTDSTNDSVLKLKRNTHKLFRASSKVIKSEEDVLYYINNKNFLRAILLAK